ncbi:LacI family DNA-binding transcriptional regulator [Streptomyces endophyticus]|uniref:Substrate-binding domain-containing protein n=1 Tax=Streptomyces endophyticus TaxID=714166 RepID=A0ABU6F3K6_9ACTN|nr:substrate-binding domain-containing protein [Streptomyces endophyticus]MEB8338222.1 substrate-binding domain-containing protein [Streptomyces endophyticus]
MSTSGTGSAPQARPRITIKEIAAEAGVSVPTVSKVLNGHAHVAPATRERVESLLERHAYPRRPRKPAAVPARAGTTGPLIADLVFPVLDSEWALAVLRGAERVAHEAGIGVVVNAFREDEADQRRWLEQVRARGSAGVVLAVVGLAPAFATSVHELGIPVVAVDATGTPHPHAATVGVTNWQGAYTATAHLTELGHRRIACIAGRDDLRCSAARVDGYRSALRAAGLDVDEELILPGDFHAESAEEAALELLSGPERPTAVATGNDQQAIGVMRAARRLGIDVPAALSVVGFDDLAAARTSEPPLTTVRQPVSEMAALALRMILHHREHGAFEVTQMELASELVVRGSTAPPPEG